VTAAPPEGPAIWIFGSNDLSRDLRAVGHVNVETCGEPQPSRVRVAIDTDRLQAMTGGDIVEFELAVEGGTDPDEVGNRMLHDAIRVKDVATVTREPRPSRCYAYLHDGKPTIAHVVSPLPGFDGDARAKIDAIAREAAATIVHDDESIEARFSVDPNSSFEARRRVAADYALRGKMARGLDVVGASMSFDGTGSLLIRKPASVDTIKGLIKETYGVAWGGIRGAHRLELTIEADDRAALEKRAKEVKQRVSTLEGVGTPVTSSVGGMDIFVYDVDTAAAEKNGISVPALQRIASTLQGDFDDEAPVFIEPRPLDKLFVRGAPLSAYVHPRSRVVPVRLFRANRKPSVELAFETDDKNAAARARQALGDSADVSVRVVPAF
jgi:multidrug efflux pump subunit AcrB